MTDEENKAIEHLKNYPVNWELTYEVNQIALNIILNLIEKQQAEINKKDKIIDEMAKQLAGLAIWNNDIEEALILGDKKEVIEYFTNKVKGEQNDKI